MKVERKMEAIERSAVIEHQPVDRQIGFSDQQAIAAIFLSDAAHFCDREMNLRLVRKCA